ncbi:MmgE/PrpD family protein [Burkholderia contaminans]|uniref:MmgE/PrpD family protein n=1 Tax=Burkholderia contaminans TaxID=488447 RepID=A0A3N8PTQ5_9BURK|nr:MmgE/PrpD family protein [Burkholderia contaminans]RQT14951.1 MmgE/PrpD family protein [Burkholderia contaminans]
MNTTRQIAEFACRTTFDDFDEDVVRHVKHVLLSGLGMTVAGVHTSAGKAVLAYVKECAAPEEVGVLGAGFRTSVEYATIANGTTSHATELEDDTREDSMYSVGVFPGVFALGEKLHVSGKEIIEAFVIAWDVASKLGLASTSMLKRGLATWSAFSTVGVAAASARMLKLDVEQTTMAVSLAASHACGLYKQVGAGAHLYESGLAGRNGVACGLLARHGLTGQPDILEIPLGYLDAVAGVTYPDLKLGAPYRALDIEMKRYPCCFSQMHIIDAFVQLVADLDPTPDTVESVQLDVGPSFMMAAARFQHPKDENEAKFSLAHSIACCFIDKKPWIESYTTERANDPAVKAFRDKVKVVLRSRWGSADAAPATLPIVVTLKDGTVHRRQTPRILDRHVLSEVEVLDKYMRSATVTLSRERAARIAQSILALENVPDIAETMMLLTYPDKV